MGKPSKTKPARSQRVERAKEPAASSDLPLTLQQKCLDIFRDALWTSADDLAVVQEIKGHLFKRDFATAFSKPEYLQAYALRWSPSRALCYASIFASISEHVSTSHEQSTSSQPLHVVSIGGGAGAELVGLAVWLNSCSQRGQHSAKRPAISSVRAVLVDIAEWAEIVCSLSTGVTSPPKLSQYASAIAKEHNTAMLLNGTFAASFHRADVLDEALQDTWLSAAREATLITIMFTLNELYTTSMPRTQAFLKALTAATQPPSLLLVVDSPGSYSTVKLNAGEKKYPMQWLLDYSLRGPPGDNANTEHWERLITEDSCWHRLPAGLQYPVDMEDMRYQIHLYRRHPHPL